MREAEWSPSFFLLANAVSSAKGVCFARKSRRFVNKSVENLEGYDVLPNFATKEVIITIRIKIYMELEDCLRAGTLLRGGKYRIVKPIGQGGFGITYKAKYRHEVQEAIGKMVVESDVAIKEFFIASECERDENSNAVTVPSKKKAGFIDDYRKKFVKEANNLSRLNHENIVKVIDTFEENSTAYFVMEYIDGESLDAMVEKQGAMSESKAKEVIGQLAKAVDYIHRNNVSHFDIKPANILVNESGCLKLVDFGLAKHYDSDGKQTSTGLVQGISEGFSPVEQYEVGALKSFSPQSDIYSVGATMAYLLTGKVPPSATKSQLPALSSSISETVKYGIYAAMANKASDRPQTIGEFMQMIGEELQPQTGKTTGGIGLATEKREDVVPQPCLYGPPFPQGGEDPNGTKVIGGGGNGNNSDLKYWIIGGVIAIALLIFGIRSCENSNLEPTPEPIEDTLIAVEADSAAPDEVATEEAPEQADEPEPKELKAVTSGYINGHEWVDLGLPSGVKWATCNVGASSPSDYGNYYAWGETTTKSEYTKENSKTYGKSMGDISGDPEYDAARANWGGSWRMPTEAEFKELVENCNWAKIEYGGRGYGGLKATSKTNGNSIFFPATGRRLKTFLYEDGISGCCIYWCSTHSFEQTGNNFADYFSACLNYDLPDRYDVFHKVRYEGITIRPVSD